MSPWPLTHSVCLGDFPTLLLGRGHYPSPAQSFTVPYTDPVTSQSLHRLGASLTPHCFSSLTPKQACPFPASACSRLLHCAAGASSITNSFSALSCLNLCMRGRTAWKMPLGQKSRLLELSSHDQACFLGKA